MIRNNTLGARSSGLLVGLLFAVCCGAAYLFGLYSHSRNLWPVEALRGLHRGPTAGTYDAVGGLVAYPGKVEVACPPQTSDTAIILAIGQSSITNSGAKRITTAYPDRVLNYFNGKCYVAASPLLGASGEDGEYLTLMADKLVRDGRYKTIVLISSGVGGTAISRWQADGDLNDRLLAMLAGLQHGYKVTEMLWHQGENDFANSTSAKVYRRSFLSLLESLRRRGIDAPVFAAISTKCGPSWVPNNPTATAQRELVAEGFVRLGADTDNLLTAADRQLDDCHFNESGQTKTATAFAEAIETLRQGR